MTSPVAGIDYSLRQLNVAVVSGPTLVTARAYSLGVDLASRIAVIQRVLDELTLLPKTHACDAPSVIVMERTWMREGRGMGTAQKLHQIPVQVEALAALYGIEVVYVPVNTWHKTILGNGGISSEAGKVLSVQRAKQMYPGFEPDSADEADAVCLATYGARTAKVRERVGAR